MATNIYQWMANVPNVFNKIFTSHDWYKLVKTNTLYFAMAKYWQNIADWQ